MVWQGIAERGNPDPTIAAKGLLAALLDIGVLVFREGLECILVLAAITAGMTGPLTAYKAPIAAGAGAAFLATCATWFVAVGFLNRLAEGIPALTLQAATGLLAVIVLVIVMNWFFHKVYWTGWISLHNKRKRELLDADDGAANSSRRLLWGMALLGFSSLYREGFEVVLFLQSYRLKLGGQPVLYGVLLGLLFTCIVAVLTFVAHRKLPYKKMLVLTGILLGVVLLVMVGEQAQEMQLAHWIPTTPLPEVAPMLPAWASLWFSVFPTVETLSAQFVAGLLVLGSYFVARR